MSSRIFNLNALLVLAFAFILTACQKENLNELTENFTDPTEMGERGPKGKKGHKRPKCFKHVFPVTFNFPDGSSETVADKDEAKAALDAWKAANPDATERPKIAMPFDVMLRDSSIITIATEEDLAALKESCEGQKGPRKPHCFKPVFPFTINFPDGSTATVNNKEEADAAKKAWKEANPDATERPTIAIPFDVMLRDSSVITIATEEDLAALKERCEDMRGPRGPRCFKPVFPFTLNFADGTSATVADKDEAKAALDAWKAANPDATEKPTIAFPHDVELKDGTVVTLEKQEDLEALKEGCEGPRGGKRPGGN